MGRAAQGIRQRWSAIRYARIAAVFPIHSKESSFVSQPAGAGALGRRHNKEGSWYALHAALGFNYLVQKEQPRQKGRLFGVLFVLGGSLC